MPLTRISAPDPNAPILSLEEAREQLRVTACGSPAEHPDDSLIQTLVGIVTNELDGVDGWLGRALIDQDWLLTLDYFPGQGYGYWSRHRRIWGGYDWPCRGDRIYLPLTSPKYSGDSPTPDPILSFTYTDINGVTQTLVEGTDYRLVTDSDPIYVEPVYNSCWPTARDISGAVRIEYTAGYGAAASDIPAQIMAYVRVRLGQLYEFRELVVAGVTVAEVPYLRDSLENVRMRGVS